MKGRHEQGREAILVGSKSCPCGGGFVSAQPIERLPGGDAEIIFLPMLTPTRAVDLFLVDFVNRSRSRNGRSVTSYRRLLDKFTDSLPNKDVTEITADDCRAWLGDYSKRAAGTRSTNYSVLNSFLEWLYLQQRIKKNPLDHVPRPRRIAPEDLNVTTVSTVDVPRLLAACDSHTERLSIAIPAYIGPRRHAMATLRLRDYDRGAQTITFSEKGSKEIRKPVPVELAVLINDAIQEPSDLTLLQHRRGSIWHPDDYLIPPEGKLSRAGERDDRVIWRVVKKIAARAGIDCHVHALRAAFATFYLEQNTGDLEALRLLMGHAALSTTQVYLRKHDRGLAMERVRSLSWASVSDPNLLSDLKPQFAEFEFGTSRFMEAGGFEPPNGENRLAGTPGRKRSGQA